MLPFEDVLVHQTAAVTNSKAQETFKSDFSFPKEMLTKRTLTLISWWNPQLTTQDGNSRRHVKMGRVQGLGARSFSVSGGLSAAGSVPLL